MYLLAIGIGVLIVLYLFVKDNKNEIPQVIHRHKDDEIKVEINIARMVDNKSTENYTITINKKIYKNGNLERTEKEDLIIQKNQIEDGY